MRLLLKREQDLKVNLHSLTEEYQREKNDSDNNEIIENMESPSTMQVTKVKTKQIPLQQSYILK